VSNIPPINDDDLENFRINMHQKNFRDGNEVGLQCGRLPKTVPGAPRSSRSQGS
jgi:hypothetical protein